MTDQQTHHHAEAVDIRPMEIVGDVANAALQYHAQGMSALEE